jgi:hypothetical protein
VTTPSILTAAGSSIRSGLIALSDGLRAFFAANAVPAIVTPVGFRYRTFQTNQGPDGGSRVCLIPGKIDPTSPAPPKVLEAGTFRGASQSANRSGPGGPRPLATWDRIVSLSVWGVDPSDTSNDELQLAATENLLEWTYRGLHAAVDPVTGKNVGLSAVELQDAAWVAPPVERAFGRELVAWFVHSGPLYDLVPRLTFPTPVLTKGPIT